MFLVLIYYIHDLPKQKLMQRKMQFVAYEMAAILQNIAKQKTGDAKITKGDLGNAMRLAYLSIFPGNSMEGQSLDPACFPLGYYPYVHVMHLKGTGSNMATGKWVLRGWGGGDKYCYISGAAQTNLMYTSRESAASAFWPTLKISNGEAKIVIQCALYYDQTGSYNETFSAGVYKGKKCGDVSSRDAFNFLLLKPDGVGNKRAGFYPAVVIFTPVGTGFSEEAPK